MPAKSFEVVSLGIDWITATAKDSYQVEAMSKLGSRLLVNQLESGFEIKPWSSHGFSGWSAGEAITAKRGQERYVRLSGWLASTQWRRLYEVANNVTRVDYQLTSRTDQPANKRIRKCWKSSGGAQHKTGRRQKRTQVQSDDGGYTVYFGSRQSAFFGRVYNKEVESGLVQFQNCVRHELEIHKGPAICFLRELAKAADARSQIFDVVVGWFAVRARSLLLELPSDLVSGSAPNSCFAPDVTYAPKKISDVHRKLEWMRSQVAPSVRFLIAQGCGDAALEVLFNHNNPDPCVDMGQLAQLQINAQEVM